MSSLPSTSDQLQLLQLEYERRLHYERQRMEEEMRRRESDMRRMMEMQRHIQPTYMWSDATSTGSLTYSCSTGVMLPEEAPPKPPRDEAKFRRMEKRRRKKKARYVGKVLTLDCKGYANDQICIEQTVDTVTVVAVTAPHTKNTRNLDCTKEAFYTVTKARIDLPVIQTVFAALNTGEPNDTTKALARMLNFPLPERAPNLPVLIQDQLLLSRNMEKILSTFCEDNQKKSRALVKQLFTEMFTLMEIHKNEMDGRVTVDVREPRERIEIAGGRKEITYSQQST